MADQGQGSRPDDGASPSRGGIAGWQARQDTGGGIADFLQPQRLDDMLGRMYPSAAADAAPGQRLRHLVRSTAPRSTAQAGSSDQPNPASTGSGGEQDRDGTHAASTPAGGARREAAPSARAAGRRLGNIVGNIAGYLQPKRALDGFQSPTTKAAADAAMVRRQATSFRSATQRGIVWTGPSSPRSSPRGSRGRGGRSDTQTAAGSPGGARRAAAPR